MKRAASPAKTGATLFWRSQLALKPAVRAVAFEGIEPIALGAFKPARPVAVSRHRQVAARTARIRNCLPHRGNLRPESQQVHSKYNCCGRKIDSIDQATELLRRSTARGFCPLGSFSGSTRRVARPRGDGLPPSC